MTEGSEFTREARMASILEALEVAEHELRDAHDLSLAFDDMPRTQQALEMVATITRGLVELSAQASLEDAAVLINSEIENAAISHVRDEMGRA